MGFCKNSSVCHILTSQIIFTPSDLIEYCLLNSIDKFLICCVFRFDQISNRRKSLSAGSISCSPAEFTITAYTKWFAKSAPFLFLNWIINLGSMYFSRTYAVVPDTVLIDLVIVCICRCRFFSLALKAPYRLSIPISCLDTIYGVRLAVVHFSNVGLN